MMRIRRLTKKKEKNFRNYRYLPCIYKYGRDLVKLKWNSFFFVFNSLFIYRKEEKFWKKYSDYGDEGWTSQGRESYLKKQNKKDESPYTQQPPTSYSSSL